MLPELPKARRKIIEMWNTVFFSGFHNCHPFVAQVPVRSQKEGNTASLYGKEIKYQKASATGSFKARDAEGMNCAEFFGFARKLGEEIGAEQAKAIFQAMSEPSPRSMPLHWNGPLKFEMVLDTWEKMEIDFDCDGKPIWPEIVPTPEFQAEFNTKFPQWLEDAVNKTAIATLIIRKRKEFDEREARRRLVD
jgi:hypothetical protein